MLAIPEETRKTLDQENDPKIDGDIGLVHVDPSSPGFTRRALKHGFGYYDTHRKRIRDRATITRLDAIALPPAYTDAWFAPAANAHILATGKDAAGRRQYRYHPRFREWRETIKYERMLDFAASLPTIREEVSRHMRRQGLPREKVLATVVWLLETTMIRVGNSDYARRNKSYGLTTLRCRHVSVEKSKLRFDFKGKSGRSWRLKVTDRRVARIVKAMQELPGQHLFQYLDDDGERREVSSSDINAYLRDISGRDITAKDFRTWSGTVLAAIALSEYELFDSDAAAKRNIREAIEGVAARLGNTPAVCRKCYIHPEVFEAYLSRELTEAALDSIAAELVEDPGHLDSEEALVLAFLRRRLGAGA